MEFLHTEIRFSWNLKVIYLLLLALFMITCSSCASTESINKLNQQIEKLSTEIKANNELLTNAEKDITDLQTELSTSSLEFRKQFKKIDNTINNLVYLPVSEKVIHKLEKDINILQAKMDAIQGKKLAKEIKQIQAEAKEEKQEEAKDAQQDRIRARDLREKMVNSEVLYKKALKLFNNKKYDQASTLFIKHNHEHPDTDLSDNAQYWLGECYFAKGKIIEAIKEFQKVLTNYPDGNKIPDSTYMIGVSYEKLGEIKKAVEFYDKVMKDYPDSQARKLAYTKRYKLRLRR